VDTVGELARALGPNRGFRLGAEGSVSVYPASPRVLLPGQSSSWRTAKPQPSPARAQAVPIAKPGTAAQLARRERSQIRLRQKHLASKMWATIRVVSRLLAWRGRARAHRVENFAHMLDRQVERRAPHTANRVSHHDAAVAGHIGGARKLRMLVGRLLLQQWPSARARCPRPAALPAPSTLSTVAAQPQPALALPPFAAEPAATFGARGRRRQGGPRRLRAAG
jgi:hypothetical protein